VISEAVANHINSLTDVAWLKLLLKQAVLTPSLAEFQSLLTSREQNHQSTSAPEDKASA
jgi:hypothetical protein